jgi:hypothetical protein
MSALKNPNADQWANFPDHNERIGWDMEASAVRFESADEVDFQDFDELPVFEKITKRRTKSK